MSHSRGHSMLRWLVAILWMAICILPASAHPANIASARAKIGTDGKAEIEIRFDFLSYLLDVKPREADDAQMRSLLELSASELAPQIAEAKSRLSKELVAVGGNIDAINFPSAGEVQDWVRRNGKDVLPMMLTTNVKAHFPTPGGVSSFRFPESFDTVVLTTEFPYEEPISEAVDSGRSSRSLRIPTTADVAAAKSSFDAARTPAPKAVVVKESAPPPAKIAKGRDAAPAEPSAWERLFAAIEKSNRALPNGEKTKEDAPQQKPALPPIEAPKVSAVPITVEPAPVQPSESHELARSPDAPRWSQTVLGFLRMGYLHILPQGLDHILFVLGLFLLSPRTRDLLKQITAFTVAHSLTLGLSLYGVIQLPSSIVEPLIAASIAFVAIENLFTSKMKSWRVAVVFAFGLVHGLGFAGALRDLGLAKANFLLALVGFNCGVELGQLTVVLAALMAVGWFRKDERYRAYVTMPASILIAAIALFWTVQRIL